jgi:DNA topoisomerase-2
VQEGQVHPSQYDYLLTMPLWSLSEEKIEELNNDMKKKKDDHDSLEKTHINEIWDRDLENFLVALTKQEDIDEKDRLSHKGVANEGKKKNRKKAIKAGKAEPNLKAKEAIEKLTDTKKPKAKVGKQKKQDIDPVPNKPIEEMSLRERLALKAN